MSSYRINGERPGNSGARGAETDDAVLQREARVLAAEEMDFGSRGQKGTAEEDVGLTSETASGSGFEVDVSTGMGTGWDREKEHRDYANLYKQNLGDWSGDRGSDVQRQVVANQDETPLLQGAPVGAAFSKQPSLRIISTNEGGQPISLDMLSAGQVASKPLSNVQQERAVQTLEVGSESLLADRVAQQSQLDALAADEFAPATEIFDMADRVTANTADMGVELGDLTSTAQTLQGRAVQQEAVEAFVQSAGGAFAAQISDFAQIKPIAEAMWRDAADLGHLSRGGQTLDIEASQAAAEDHAEATRDTYMQRLSVAQEAVLATQNPDLIEGLERVKKSAEVDGVPVTDRALSEYWPQMAGERAAFRSGVERFDALRQSLGETSLREELEVPMREMLGDLDQGFRNLNAMTALNSVRFGYDDATGAVPQVVQDLKDLGFTVDAYTQSDGMWATGQVIELSAGTTDLMTQDLRMVTQPNVSPNEMEWSQ